MLLLEEVNALLEDLARNLMPLVLIAHKLVSEQGGEMLEAIAFDSWQEKHGCVVDATHCGRPATLQKVADFAEDSTRSNLAQVVFAPCEVRARHATLSLRQEVERRGRASLAYDDVFGKLLKRLANGANEGQLALQDRIRLDGPLKEFALITDNFEQVLCDVGLQTRRQVLQESVQLFLKVLAVVT